MKSLFVLFAIKNCLLSAVLFAMLSVRLEPLSDGFYVIAITTLAVVVFGLTWIELLISRGIIKHLD